MDPDFFARDGDGDGESDTLILQLEHKWHYQTLKSSEVSVKAKQREKREAKR